jgi:type II secretory pathway component GspD/PulD (secretin)
VLARPTLVALDRQPSTFFSGSSLSATVTGAYSSTLVEHPAGISLSVTPTFIDDETLLLSVRVARSFFAGSLDLQNDTIVKSRNAVSANVMMKMGETLILSGLTERQLNESKKGVPLLKDIPVLQYLFSTETNNDLTQSVLVMITPRLPVTGVNAPVANRDAAGDPRQQSSLKELREQIPATLRPTPNLDLVFLDMEDNRLFREFRSGDIRADDWRRPPRIERTLKQIVDFLYY